MNAEIGLAGLIVGFLVGLTGVGGGAVMTPLLILIGVPATVAVGSDLAYASVTKLVGAGQHWRQGHVLWHWVTWTAVGGVPASWLGTAAIHLMRAGGYPVDAMIKQALGAVLILVAGLSVARELGAWRRRRPQGGFEDSVSGGCAVSAVCRPPVLVALGSGIGFLVGMTSVGSGTLFAAVLLACTRLSPRHLVGTDIAQGAVLVTAAALAHALIGTVDWLLTGNLLLGSVPGVLLGSLITSRVPARPLKLGLAGLILYGGFKLTLPAP